MVFLSAFDFSQWLRHSVWAIHFAGTGDVEDRNTETKMGRAPEMWHLRVAQCDAEPVQSPEIVAAVLHCAQYLIAVVADDEVERGAEFGLRMKRHRTSGQGVASGSPQQQTP
jgi:hypothetical protein